jgi:hypothetical protein
MGLVYRARDPRLGREVAIKVLPDAFSTDRDRLRRFEQEARAAASLNHANIVGIYDVGTYDGQPYVVSELLEGQTLRAILRSGAIPLDLVIRYAMQICQGLAAAHQRGIVHRDLKPENLFIVKDGRLKILDFGLAKLVEGRFPSASTGRTDTTEVSTTGAGVVMGTVGYMSPEQARGAPTDHRSDIFTLGAILYEMITGRRAFQAENPVETLYAILKSRPPSFSRIGDGVRNALDAVVKRCLEKEPENRFQTVGEIFKLRSAQLVLTPAAESRAVVDAPALIEIPALNDESADQPHWAVWMGPIFGIAVILLLVAFRVTTSIPIWDELPPVARFGTLLLTVAAIHLTSAVVSSRSPVTGRTIRTIATLWLGGAIFITTRIFDLEEYWPTSILLWAFGSWLGWWLMKDAAPLALAAILLPAGLAAQWQQVSAHAVASHRVGVIAVGLVLTSLAYLTAPDEHPFEVRGRVLRRIGALTLIPTVFGLGIAVALASQGPWSFPSLGSLPNGLLLLGWVTSVGFPTVVAAILRKGEAWVNGVAAGWAVIAIRIPFSTTTGPLALILWCTVGAIALVASGVRESRPERINVGAAICGIALILLTPFCWRLIGWPTLLILGLSMWPLEKTRRRLVAAVRGRL